VLRRQAPGSARPSQERRAAGAMPMHLGRGPSWRAALGRAALGRAASGGCASREGRVGARAGGTARRSWPKCFRVPLFEHV
jgi:hypothetical protein